MAITTYSELQTAIGAWMGRPGDTFVTTYATDWIALFEAWFKQRYRFRRMLTTTSLTIDAQTESLPADFLEVRNLYLTGSDPTRNLLHRSIDWIRSNYDDNDSGIPAFYNVGGSAITFAPVPSGSYTATLEYWAFAALSGSNTTNWLLTYYPHVYLRGALREAYGMEGGGMEHPALTTADAALKEALADMEREEMGVMMSQNAAMGLDVYTP